MACPHKDLQEDLRRCMIARGRAIVFDLLGECVASDPGSLQVAMQRPEPNRGKESGTITMLLQA